MSARKITGGSVSLVEVITDDDLVDSGGKYKLAGRVATPVVGVSGPFTRPVSSEKYIPVYVVDASQIESGQFKLLGGASEHVTDTSIPSRKREGSLVAIPVYLVSGSIGEEAPVVPSEPGPSQIIFLGLGPNETVATFIGLGFGV